VLFGRSRDDSVENLFEDDEIGDFPNDEGILCVFVKFRNCL